MEPKLTPENYFPVGEIIYQEGLGLKRALGSFFGLIGGILLLMLVILLFSLRELNTDELVSAASLLLVTVFAMIMTSAPLYYLAYRNIFFRIREGGIELGGAWGNEFIPFERIKWIGPRKSHSIKKEVQVSGLGEITLGRLYTNFFPLFLGLLQNKGKRLGWSILHQKGDSLYLLTFHPNKSYISALKEFLGEGTAIFEPANSPFKEE